MSFGEYLNLLCEISQAIDWEAKRERLMFIINRYLPDDSGDEVTDVNSSLAKLEEKSLLGIDRLDVLKDLLKGIREWRLLEIVDGFEFKRKEYKQFLGKIIRALDESNELQRLISIYKRQNLIAHEREEHIANVDTLFAELEQQKKLGVGNLGILRTMATDLEKPDLCRLLDDFEEKRKQEDDVERKREEWDDYKKRARGKG